jgi:hypothetical protein
MTKKTKTEFQKSILDIFFKKNEEVAPQFLCNLSNKLTS